MRCIWSLSRASTIVALLSSVGLGLGVTPARADDTDTDTEFARQLPVEERVLAEMRGGFTFDSGGFHASFAIIREVLLNGQLVLQGRIVITNLDAMLSGRAPTVEITGATAAIVQNGAGNIAPSTFVPSSTTTYATAPTVTSVPSVPIVSNTPIVTNSTSAASATTVPSVATQTTTTAPIVTTTAVPVQSTVSIATPGAAVSSASAAPGVATPGSATVISNTGTSSPALTVLTSTIPTRESILLGVQNTIDSQLIQTRTTINAAITSINLMRAQLTGSSLRDQIISGLNR